MTEKSPLVLKNIVNHLLSVIWTFFSLISPSDIVSFNELTLKLKIICLCDVKHIKTLPIKPNASVLKVLTYIIISITCHPIDLAAILSIMSILTFKTADTLYIHLIISWYF